MICPDFESSDLEDKTWKLMGDPSSFKGKKGEFVIERCIDEPFCESKENIDKFVSDL